MRSVIVRYSVLIALFFTVASCYFLAAGEAVVSVTVTDEYGTPIPASEVRARWHLARALGTGWGVGDEVQSSSKTDERGKCSLHIGDRSSDISAVSNGYYRGGINADTFSAMLQNGILALNRPSVDIRLMKKVNPVPMYVKYLRENAFGKVPKIGSKCGFDLMAGDWIAPHGNGLISDFEVTVTSQVTDQKTWRRSFRLSFSNHGEGIIGAIIPYRNRTCELRLPREAPIDGYEDEIYWEEHRIGDKMVVHDGENDNYMFRIRKRPSDKAGAAEWMYGKIHGPVRATQNGVEFTYYLNPSGSRSLEWDCVNNLFGKIPDREKFFPEP